MPLTRTAATFPSPVMEARRWLDGITFPPERPLINVSQAGALQAEAVMLMDRAGYD